MIHKLLSPHQASQFDVTRNLCSQDASRDDDSHPFYGFQFIIWDSRGMGVDTMTISQRSVRAILESIDPISRPYYFVTDRNGSPAPFQPVVDDTETAA